MFGRKRRKMYTFLLFHLGYMLVKDNQFIFRCFDCKKSYKNENGLPWFFKTIINNLLRLEDLQI